MWMRRSAFSRTIPVWKIWSGGWPRHIFARVSPRLITLDLLFSDTLDNSWGRGGNIGNHFVSDLWPQGRDVLSQPHRALGDQDGANGTCAVYQSNYQYHWHIFRRWCISEGHSSVHPSIPKIADYLLFFCFARGCPCLLLRVIGLSGVASWKTFSLTLLFLMHSMISLRSFEVQTSVEPPVSMGFE